MDSCIIFASRCTGKPVILKPGKLEVGVCQPPVTFPLQILSKVLMVGFRPAAAIRVALPGGGRNPMTATAGGLMGGCSRRGGAAARFRRNRVAEPPTGTKWRSHVPWGTGAKRRGGGNGSIEKGPSRVRRPFFGGASRIRTGDPLLAKQVLYQLSYNPGDVPGPWGRGEGTKKAGLASGL